MNTEQFKQEVVTGYREALGILFEMPFFLGDMTEDYIQKAISQAKILYAIIYGEGIQISTKEETPKVEEKKEEEDKKSDKSESVGIGGLFG